ncbi:MAG TPA: hypothetical protein VKU41_18915 [Polyangiaceae bacterium]|nr:hypothetical protein [Polyangiaceae bacterium]
MAAADGAAVGAPADAAHVAEAREEFQRGARLASDSHWPEALAAFEHSAKLRSHAVTTFNVGVCERAMGHFTLARSTLEHALAEDTAAVGKLPDVLVDDAHRYIDEIDRALAVVDVHTPPGAEIGVDGCPLLVRSPSASPPVLVAGVLAPGRGAAPPAALFRLLVDPGSHRFTVSVGGRERSVVTEFAPATRAHIDLGIDAPPAPTGTRR